MQGTYLYIQLTDYSTLISSEYVFSEFGVLQQIMFTVCKMGYKLCEHKFYCTVKRNGEICSVGFFCRLFEFNKSFTRVLYL